MYSILPECPADNPVGPGKPAGVGTHRGFAGGASAGLEYNYRLVPGYLAGFFEKGLTLINIFGVDGQTSCFFIFGKIAQEVRFIQIAFVAQTDKGPHSKADIAGIPQGLHPHRTALCDKGNSASPGQGFIAMLHKNCIQACFREKYSQGIGAENPGSISPRQSL